MTPKRASAAPLLYRTAVRLRGEASVFARQADMERMQWESTSQLEDRQRRLLVRLLDRALSDVPHYRSWRRLAVDLTPDAVIERLRQIPPLDKERLQEDVNGLTSRVWKGRYSSKTTGGSTGRPVTVRKDGGAIAQEMAATWMGYGWFGVNVGDRCVRFWGQPARNLKRRLRYRAADAAVRRTTLSAFGYSRADLESYLRTIERARPTYLYGYVSAIEDLARYTLEQPGPGPIPSLRVVITTSEVLTAPQRAVIEEAFQVPVQNEYGCGEVGPIAYECPEGSLHLLPTNQYVEVVGDDGAPMPDGEPGSLLITDLTNQVMPLIRYRVGDVGVLGGVCSCGRGFPVLSDVFGREYDFVEAPDGRRFHGEFFMYLFEDLRRAHPEIGQFQVVQHGEASLHVRMVVPDSVFPAADAAVRLELERRLPAFHCSTERVAAIQRRPSGKMRVVENRLAEPTRTTSLRGR